MTANDNHYDVIILGAGAAGLYCAQFFAASNKKVLIIEKSNQAGKKILMSGGSRCNFTNYDISPSNYLSANPHFCKSALARHTQWDVIEFASNNNIAFHEKTLGQLFCDDGAKDFLRGLLDSINTSNIELKTDCTTLSCNSADNKVFLNTTAGGYSCDALVVATGGLSIPTLGGSGYGYSLAELLGAHLLPRRAGLVPFILTDNNSAMCTDLSGLSIDVSVQTQTVEAGIQSFSESMLFTHRGLSGPAILQISSYWQEGQAIHVDLLPTENFVDFFTQEKEKNPKLFIGTVLSRLLPKRLGKHILANCDIASELSVAALSAKEIKTLNDHLHHWKITPASTEGYRTAEVTLGGVSTDALSSKTLALKNQDNIYFIGEVVDVTGWLGGYNFQWAWSSAAACAQSILTAPKKQS